MKERTRPIGEAIRWLLQPESRREVTLLQELVTGPLGYQELSTRAGIEHPPQFYRSIGYLEDYGLVERFNDFSKRRRGYLLRLSSIGQRALEMVDRVEETIRAGSNEADRRPATRTHEALKSPSK